VGSLGAGCCSRFPGGAAPTIDRGPTRAGVRAGHGGRAGGRRRLNIDVANIFGDGCFEVRIIGACPCPEPPYVCVQIEYWEPRLLIVTEQVQATGPTRSPAGQ
jgi:hypothetical protein